MDTDTDSEFLTGDEVARLLRQRPSSIKAWRRDNVGPPWMRLPTSRTANGGHHPTSPVVYRRADVIAWLIDGQNGPGLPK